MVKNIKELFIKINKNFNKNYGLKKLIPIINDYNGNDWKKYVNFEENKYFRNSIFKNDNIEIVIISWNNSQYSGFHNHPEYGCILKVLDGEIIEQTTINNIYHNNILKKNSIGFQQGKFGIHNIINKNNKSVSLHVYSPPINLS
jgi:cysteine dioxygenase